MINNFKFEQNPCLGDLTCAGYTVAKHGILAMTRAFQTCHPKPQNSEGIKCYALAPTGCDTNLVRSLFVKVLSIKIDFQPC